MTLVRPCHYHLERPSIAICSTCEQDICVGCHGATLVGLAICDACEKEFQAANQPPWELAEPLGMPRAFFDTAVALLRAPSTFFHHVALSGNWVRPALFGIICVGVGTLAGIGWQYASEGDFGRLQPLADNPALVPLVIPMVFGVQVAILLAALRIAGAKATWSQSVRIVGYCSAAHLLELFPPIASFPLGHFLAIVWLFRAQVSAVSHYFEMSFWRAYAVVLVPFIVTALFA